MYISWTNGRCRQPINGDDDARIGVMWREHAILGVGVWYDSRVCLPRTEHMPLGAALGKVSIQLPTKGNFGLGRRLQAVDFSACVRIRVRVRAPTSNSAAHLICLSLLICLSYEFAVRAAECRILVIH